MNFVSTFTGLKSFLKICGQIWYLPKFGDKVVRKLWTEYAHEVVGVVGDEFVPKFIPKFEDSPNLGTNVSLNLGTNSGIHEIWGRICPKIWGQIWGIPKFGDENVPKFGDKSVPNKLGNLYAESGIQIVGHSTIAFV